MKNLYNSMLCALLILCSLHSLAQVPVYNSNASAPAVLFLDFDGHTVTGTGWNFNGPVFCGPSNLNNDQITEVYKRIAEDYRPFNINVTTDSTKYLKANAYMRMRVIFTVTHEWYGRTGGVAYIGSFKWGDNTPCFVFTSALNFNVKFISEAGAHEAGHTLGLRHQAAYDANCVKTSDYNYGIGDGQISWAPIMGVGYYRNFTSWHNGPNPYGCTAAQKDLDIITSLDNGFGFRPDDFAEDFNNAGNAAFNGNKFNVEGMITSPTDKDMFKFTVDAAKRIKLDALPTSVGDGDAGSNLDLQVQLFDASKKMVGDYNPPLTLSASVDTFLNAGTYYLLVNGTGNQYTTNYGSLGSYTLKAESPLVTLPVRQLELKGVAEGAQHRLNWKIDADETVVKQVIEFSTNGRDWSPVSEAGAEARTYLYTTELVGTLFYRVAVTFDDKRKYFSNTIAIRSNGNAAKPKLVSNIVTGTQIMVTSPSIFTYIVSDFNGRTINTGQISAGSSTIKTNTLTNGTYVIRFSNGREQYSEKFLKQ